MIDKALRAVDYLDLEVVWKTIQNDLHSLRRRINAIVNESYIRSRSGADPMPTVVNDRFEATKNRTNLRTIRIGAEATQVSVACEPYSRGA